jgi:hypothetical protein
MKDDFSGGYMRRLLLAAALVLIAVPLHAQKPKKRDPYKITAEELAEYGEMPLFEVIEKARPNFLMFNGGQTAGIQEQAMSGRAYNLDVYTGSQRQGDASMLHYYKASEVKEIRYYKPGNALSPNTGANSYVIQLTVKTAEDRR